MRIIVVLGLLIACLGIAVLSHVGNESLSGNVTGITLNDIRCGTCHLAVIFYRCLINGWQSFQHLVHILQSSLIVRIMINLYYFILTLLACDIFFTVFIKPRFFPSEESEEIDDSDNESLGGFCFSRTSSTISINMLFEQESSNSVVSLNEIKKSRSLISLCSSQSSVAWKAESFAPEQSFFQRRRSFSGFERSSSFQTLAGLKRLCKSLPSLDSVFGGSSMIRDVLNISSLDISSTQSSIAYPSPPASSATSSFQSIYSSRSSLNMLALSRGSHDLFALNRSMENIALTASRESSVFNRSRESAVLTGSSISQLSGEPVALPFGHQDGSHSVASRNSLSSIALSLHSNPTIWTMYVYPVPGSVTSSDPHQFQLRRADREYVFVQRPFAMALPDVNSWLQKNFFDSPATSVANSEPEINNNQEPSGSWVGQPNQGNQMIQANQSAHYQATFLMNAQKTEVVLSGIPADATKKYSGRLLQMVRDQTRGSMIELHHTARWSPLNVYTSLPNICEEIGLRNAVSFNIHAATQPLNAPRMHPRSNSSVDERNDIFDDEMDSISVVCEKVERRDQALRDAARARMEQNRERQVRRLRLFREFDEVEAAPRPELPAPLSFMDILKKETYKQVLVPLLFHAGKEMALALWTS